MPKCCSPFSEAATDQFGAGVARRDVAKYRRRGPDAPTRLLRDSVLAADSSRATVLDIGGGIGALSLELIAAGVGHATLVDASASYLSAAREEATRADRTSQLDVVAGDFVELGATLPVAEIVAMHRVVCCYPDFDALWPPPSRIRRACSRSRISRRIDDASARWPNSATGFARSRARRSERSSTMSRSCTR